MTLNESFCLVLLQNVVDFLTLACSNNFRILYSESPDIPDTNSVDVVLRIGRFNSWEEILNKNFNKCFIWIYSC